MKRCLSILQRFIGTAAIQQRKDFPTFTFYQVALDLRVSAVW